MSVYHLPVAGFFVDNRDVCPVEEFDKLDHHLGLILIGRNRAHEIRKSFDRAQRRTRREETDLLKNKTDRNNSATKSIAKTNYNPCAFPIREQLTRKRIYLFDSKIVCSCSCTRSMAASKSIRNNIINASFLLKSTIIFVYTKCNQMRQR